ncbi:hypothetical protein KP509_07G070300 [Ceratopteris richardii]|uniref:Uncharacterized protein n=1 Tax=Ceratopteris richardii TaxID=49495 RepID=A0A8T2UMD1_CERRI|nr:hypothetical protein KP509_07G070300 [Ceratopteris richardii]
MTSHNGTSKAQQLDHEEDDYEEDEEEYEEEYEEEDDYEEDEEEEDYEEDEEEKYLKYHDFFDEDSREVATFGAEGRSNATESTVVSMEDEPLTTHQKQLLKVQKHIERLESANLNPASWTMQGEVTAGKRPKNSALEVELDFEHNIRPPPVITEEVTASLEDLIRKRIAENNFDDVERKSSLPSHVPDQPRELDETKSQRGLAEVYEDEFMQKTGLAPVSSAADGLRKEAIQLFKAVCVKLDALSHFHFTPKPVIEDMTVRQDVPALAMEEVAPLMVSDAQMLAPEEHFTGEGVCKSDAELSREERKRRRARRKEKAKAENRESCRRRSLTNIQRQDANGSPPSKRRKVESQYSKSRKVFEELDTTNKKVKKVEAQSEVLKASSFKL